MWLLNLKGSHMQKEKSNKAKLLIFILVVLLVTLFAVAIMQIVDIHLKNKKILEQQSEIEQLHQQQDYYESKKDGNGNSIVEGEQ